MQFIELQRVAYFVAKDKLTYAVTGEKQFVIDAGLAELEQRLDPERFIRIHRATLVNLDFVAEVHTAFAGGMVVRLKDARRTELAVARG